MSVGLAETDSWVGRAPAARDAWQDTRQVATNTRRWSAFAWALPIALFGGLMGLGGAECRLPVLAGPLRHSLRDAVPINLAVSLVTLVAASAVRLPSLSQTQLSPFIPAIVAVMTGAMVAVPAGTVAVSRLTDARLAQSVLGMLALIGIGLIGTGFLPQGDVALIPEIMRVQVMVGLALGLAVGVISSLLGVAGGVLLMPMLVFVYGLDIKTAGTVSLIISLPIVLSGIVRFFRLGAYQHNSLRGTVIPMGAGSVAGALIGGLLVGLIPAPLLTGALGVLIMYSAWRTFAVTRSGSS